MGTTGDDTHLFDDLPDRESAPLRARWWILAVVLHAALLALPVAWYASQPREDRSAVTVTLVDPAAAVRPQAQEPAPDRPATPAPSDPPDAPEEPASPAVDAPGSTLDLPAESPAPVAEDVPPTLEVQRLLETVAAMDWSEADTETPQTLGRSTESAITDALRTPVLMLSDNTFDGLTAPAEVEITDRWMSPGGEHNVVIRAPDGNTYCGRQGPVDDLRPWLQMPMLFHRCAGGGKRSGASSWRNN